VALAPRREHTTRAAPVGEKNMGMNYYLVKEPFKCCSHCGQTVDEPETIHIGKSSGGWCFSLHGIEGFAMSLDEWVPRFYEYPIIDESGTPITPQEMIGKIKDRSIPSTLQERVDKSKWYSSVEEMLIKNSAIEGPGNLMRHASSTIHGGSETWDLVLGDFS